MIVLTLDQVLRLQSRIIDLSGGSHGLRDLGRLEAALGQPFATFGGDDLYPDIPGKAAALGYSLVHGHPFVDGNKRIGHAAMETFLVLNGYELYAEVDDAEKVILGVASGEVSHAVFEEWVRDKTDQAGS
jgi:death-on-curing protein